MRRACFLRKENISMDWRMLLQENLTTAEELKSFLRLSQEEYENIQDEIRVFPMSVTRYYLSLVDPDDPDDPIRKMAIPSGYAVVADGLLDTSGEQSNTRLRGLQHKYAETVMILTTSECAMFCRYCFRRRLVGKGSEEIAADTGEVVRYIRTHPEISNVLLSGGDSFLLSTEEIAGWLEKLSKLEQLDLIRFGTRTPVTFPQRILLDPSLPEVLAAHGEKKQIYVITHFNHPREITPESIAAVRLLQKAGAVVKNQTVLMRGINDDPHVMGKLLKSVSSLGIVQHYIFQCRPVTGVKSRFQVPIGKGNDIVQKALAMQSGLGKVADYTLSHLTGKIRILGKAENGRMLFQYKQAKDPANIGKIFSLLLGPEETWLPGQLWQAKNGMHIKRR